MKKTILMPLMAVLLLFITSSCTFDNDSDDSQGNQEATLIGTWEATSIYYSGSTSLEMMGDEIVTNFYGDAYNIDARLIFKEDPNDVRSEGQYSIELVTEFMGTTFTENIELMPFEVNGTWVRDGSTLLIGNDIVEDHATILKLTATELELDIRKSETIEADGMIGTSEIQLLATYKR